MTTIYSKHQLPEVIAALKAGQVIAFPTDTVYGLGVIYENEDALARLKAAKGRPESKPIPTMAANIAQLSAVGEVTKQVEALAAAFLPGPLTLVMKKKAQVADYVTNGLPTIGVRMPKDDFVLALIEGCGLPLLVTSANRSGEATGTTFAEVMRQLDGRIDGIVEGECGLMSASTIVDVSASRIQVLREGPISQKALEDIWEAVDKQGESR